MTSDDGKWEQPTSSDDNARLDSDDHPTLAATPEQIEAGRKMSARADATPTPGKRTTAQGLSAVVPRTPGVNEEIDTANFDRVENTLETPPPFDPKSTARGLLIGSEPRSPANRSGSMPAAGSGAMPAAGNGAMAAGGSGAMPPADAKRARTTTANRSGSMAPLDANGNSTARSNASSSMPPLDAHGDTVTRTDADRSGSTPPLDSHGNTVARTDANRSGSMPPLDAHGNTVARTDANRSGSMPPADVSDGRVAPTSERRSGPATLSGLDSRGVRAPGTRAPSNSDANRSGISTADRSGSVSTADRSGGMSAADRAGGMSTADRSSSMSAADRAGGMSTADRSSSMSAAVRGGGMSTADRSGSMSAAVRGGGISAADRSGSVSTADRGGGMSTADRSSSMSAAVRGGGISAADRSGGISAADRSGGISAADRSGGIAVERPRNNTAPGASGSMTRSPAPTGDRGGGMSAQAVAATASRDDDFDPASTARGMPAIGRAQGPPGDDVVLLDRVHAPVDNAPRRTESAAGGIVVVATGADGERVRRLCHTHSLLVPVMSSLSVAHESMQIVVIGEPSPPAPDRVIHVVRPSLTDAQLVEILRALSTSRVLVDRPTQPTAADPRAREFAQRIARMTDRAAIETTMIEALTVLVDADRAYCWFFEPTTGALWSEGQRLALGDNRRAMGGLVGWAAYTGETIHASPAGDDARFLLELDDPDGKPQSRLIVQPIIGGDRRVHAVLVAVRRWRNTAFEDTQLRIVADLAALCGPALDIVASSGPRGPKFRPANTLPGPLAAAARDSAVVDARSKRPSSRPPPLTARPATTPPPPPSEHPLTATLRNMEAARSGQMDTARSGQMDAARSGQMDAARSGQVDAAKSGPVDAARRAHVPTKPPPSPVPPRITPSNGAPIASAASTASTASTASADSNSNRAPIAATASAESNRAPIATDANGTASDSRRLRASTAQPPSTSNTGRTRPITGGERTSGPLRARPFQQVAVVASDDIHDRVHRVAKTCATDVTIVTEVALAPVDARIITIGQAWSPSMDPRVVYVARDNISNDALADLITSISSGRVLGAAAQLTKPTNPNDARRAQQAFTGSRTFAAASNLAAAETSAVATMRELLDADRAYFLFYDDADGSLRSAVRGKDDRRAIAGMAGWVARTGRAASTERATTDPRWLGPIDDPDGDPNSQLILEPVIVGDRVRAVLVAARRPRRPGFVDADVQLLARFAALVAPLVDQLLLHADNAPAPSPPPSAPVSRTKRATEQAADDLRAVQPIWQRMPMWSYAAVGGVVLLLIALVASC